MYKKKMGNKSKIESEIGKKKREMENGNSL